jgi:hypothetical protein
MSLDEEMMNIVDCGHAVGETMAPEDESTRPIHFPHAVAYWSRGHYRAMMNAIARDRPVDRDRSEVVQEFIAAAFLIGVQYERGGHKYTPCTCGQLSAETVEELLSNAWHNAPGEPPQE